MDGVETHVYAIGMRSRFGGITVREGLLLREPADWGEFCPFEGYEAAESAQWLVCAREAATEGWPETVRDRVPVNCTVPSVPAEQDVTAIGVLEHAAAGLEYVEQSCRTLEGLAQVRRKVDVRIAADESIRRADDPLRVRVSEAADVAVLKTAPLGGVRGVLRAAEACGLPCVISSAVEKSVGLAAGLSLAGARPNWISPADSVRPRCGRGTSYPARSPRWMVNCRSRDVRRSPPRTARATRGRRGHS